MAARSGAPASRPCTTSRCSSRRRYIRRALKLFEEARKQLGDEVELLHDVHERVTPNQAVQFCKDAEKFRLFFMEDALSPEDIAYFRQIRAAMRHARRHGRAVQQPARMDRR